VLQDSIWNKSPVQLWPCTIVGKVQLRLRILLPPPHVTLQLVQADQFVRLASTKMIRLHFEHNEQEEEMTGARVQVEHIFITNIFKKTIISQQ